MNRPPCWPRPPLGELGQKQGRGKARQFGRFARGNLPQLTQFHRRRHPQFARQLAGLDVERQLEVLRDLQGDFAHGVTPLHTGWMPRTHGSASTVRAARCIEERSCLPASAAYSSRPCVSTCRPPGTTGQLRIARGNPERSSRHVVAKMSTGISVPALRKGGGGEGQRW